MFSALEGGGDKAVSANNVSLPAEILSDLPALWCT